MPDTSPFIRRMVATTLATWAGLLVLGIVLSRLTGFDLPAGGVAIIPPMIGGLVAGQGWAGATGAVPPARAAWRVAGVAAGTYVAAQALLVAVVLAIAPGGIAGGALLYVAAMLAALGVISVLVGRFFISTGAKGALKQAAR